MLTKKSSKKINILAVFTTLSSTGFHDAEQCYEFESCNTSLVPSNAFDDLKLKNAQILTKAIGNII
jgi:hypothetical protein